ncbi:MAG: hypothetical protein ACREJO_10690 [Phycisphaerales bacterium]
MRGPWATCAAAGLALAAGLVSPASARADSWSIGVGINLGDPWYGGCYSPPSSCYSTAWYHPVGVSYWQPTWNVSIDPYWSSCSWYRPYGYYSSGYTRTYATYSAPVVVDPAPVVAADGTIIYDAAPTVIYPATVAYTNYSYPSYSYGYSPSSCWNPCWTPYYGSSLGFGYRSGNWAFGFGVGGFALGYGSWPCTTGVWQPPCNYPSPVVYNNHSNNTTNNYYNGQPQPVVTTPGTAGSPQVVTTPGVAGPASFADESRRLSKPAVANGGAFNGGPSSPRVVQAGGKPLASPATAGSSGVVTTPGVGASGKPSMTVLPSKPATPVVVSGGKPMADYAAKPAATPMPGNWSKMPVSESGAPQVASKPAISRGYSSAPVATKPSVSQPAPVVSKPAASDGAAIKPRVSMPMVVPPKAPSPVASKPTASAPIEMPKPSNQPRIAPTPTPTPAMTNPAPSKPVVMPRAANPISAPAPVAQPAAKMPAPAPSPAPMMKAPAPSAAPAMRAPTPSPSPSPAPAGPSGGMRGGKGDKR